MERENFWNRVKALIKQSNTTQRGLSETCGFHSRAIEAWISKNTFPDVFEAFTIAQALGVSVEYLVTGKETDEKKQFIEDLKNFIDAHS